MAHVHSSRQGGERGPGALVVATMTREVDECLSIRVRGQPDPLLVTAEHPLWRAAAGFVPAGSLAVGELLATRDGVAQIEAIAKVDGPLRVFNLEVDRTNSYFVGAGLVLAHNECPGNDGEDAATGGAGGGEFSRGGPPRQAGTGNYLPDPDATGPHTTLGARTGSDGKPYTQGATFDKDGNFVGRTDVTNHGRSDHPHPHFHPASGPASVKPGPYPLPGANDPRFQLE